ncbi:MAG: PQQ-dependent sugar dehydrogenase, partial [Chloroflexi bacterium]|nr:PQQ-dependent sugar dehydrogenase [Chloroflexota bacterium]
PSPTATPSPAASPAPTASPSPAASPSPTAERALPESGSVRLEAAFGGREFQRPIELGAYPAGPDATGSVFVAEQGGRVHVLHAGGETLLLDLRPQVSRAGNEEGLLSVAVDPRFATNGHLWLYYSVDRSFDPGPRRTRLSRFSVDLEANPFAVDAGSELVILEVEQPFSNHNGGAIRFGPDGMLYLGFGDGGSAGDPRGHGQNLGTLLGSVIRIDAREASEAEPYRVPSDNPFVDTPGARAEIWAYGLRNPWRMAFDAGGRLWAGDVGQNALEEIDVIERGGNYGWNRLEGTRCYRPSSGCDEEGATPPIAEYGRNLGCSVTGGVVYEGEAIPVLAGSYLFADYCSGRLWALDPESGTIVEVARSPDQVASFGRDARGEVYLLTFGGPILRVAPADGR